MEIAGSARAFAAETMTVGTETLTISSKAGAFSGSALEIYRSAGAFKPETLTIGNATLTICSQTRANNNEAIRMPSALAGVPKIKTHRGWCKGQNY